MLYLEIDGPHPRSIGMFLFSYEKPTPEEIVLGLETIEQQFKKRCVDVRQ